MVPQDMKHNLMLAAVLIAAVLSAEASPQKRKPARKQAPGFTPLLIDLSAERLPPQYLGSDFLTLAQKLISLPEKDDFETSDAYKEKLKRLVDLERLYAFMSMAGEDDHFPCTPKYMANEHRWEVNCELDMITLATAEKYLGHHEATNAYGMKARVKTYMIHTLQIKNHGERKKGFSMTFNQSPMEAKKAAGKIRILFIGRIGSLPWTPLIVAERDIAEATSDNPIEVHKLTHTIPMTLVDVWAYNIATGEILVKFKPFEQ